MVKILFERRPNVYLPEIDAYCDYLRQNYPDVLAYDSGKLFREDVETARFDVIWRFMGYDTEKRNSAYLVHEYGSLSVPPLARIKNTLKKAINKRPHQRVFLNNHVAHGFDFQDGVPYFLRDMGIDNLFFQKHEAVKEFDIVYSGSLYRDSSILEFLRTFSENRKAGTLLVVGNVKTEDKKSLERSGNIIFTGRVPYKDVPKLLAKARYGLNLMPDIYPFNLQTSTKLLEYAASGLRIISNRYKWAEWFEQTRSAKFVWLTGNVNEFAIAACDSAVTHTPDVRDLEWPNIIQKSGLFDFLSRDFKMQAA